MIHDSQKEGRPSRWRDGLARSFVHGSTHHVRRERVEASGSWRPGAIGSRCWVVDSEGT